MAIAQPPTGEPDNGQGSQSALRRNFEPVAARIFQALILVLGMLLLLSVLLGNRWGPMVVGVLIIATTLPPLRHLVDR